VRRFVVYLSETSFRLDEHPVADRGRDWEVFRAAQLVAQWKQLTRS
jgi:hypothetical protein